MLLGTCKLLFASFAVAALVQTVASQLPSCRKPFLNDIACYCDPDGLQCKLCGDAGPFPCTTYNSTFTKNKLKTTPTDQPVTWPGFTVAEYGPLNPTVAGNKNRLLRSTTGYGEFVYTVEDIINKDGYGNLYGFDYMCAKPELVNGSRVATECNILINATVAAVDYTDYTFTQATIPWANLTYTPGLGETPAMATANYDLSWSVPGPFTPPVGPVLGGGIQAFSYSFTASMVDGCAAWLYLDNAIWVYEIL